MITAENRAEWQSLANTVSDQRPSPGKRVRVTDGKKHLGKEGLVTWHGLDRFVDAFRYASGAQATLREMAGRYGYRVGIKTDDGETFFIRADRVEVLP